MNLALPLPLPEHPRALPVARPAPTEQAIEVAAPQGRRARAKIWLALHFPQWPLFAVQSSLTTEQQAEWAKQPVAVTDGNRQRQVLACNDVATRLGVRAGHSLNAAIALCPQLNAVSRDTRKEQSLLRQLGERCLRYSPVVCLAEPDELLVEVRGSLRLFGGLQRLMDAVRTDLSGIGLIMQMSATPTPESALWLARASHREIVPPRELRGALENLPIASLRWPPDVELRLWRFGVRTVGELLRLPRGGLARRIGAERLLDVDRAMRRHPSLRRTVLATEAFRDAIRLDFEVTSTTLLEPMLRQSLQRLTSFLKHRQLTVGAVNLSLRHRDRAPTRLRISLARATADVSHLCNLLHEKLNSIALEAPVTEVHVNADRLLLAQPSDRHLFCTEDRQPHHFDERKARLYEQLRGRFGNDGLRRLQAGADHRPEKAQRSEPPLERENLSPTLPIDLRPRPLWLLPAPRPVRRDQLSNQHPWLKGPESIDAGWWDGQSVHRDYFVARSRHSALWWIFRDHTQSGRWFLHGLFG